MNLIAVGKPVYFPIVNGKWAGSYMGISTVLEHLRHPIQYASFTHSYNQTWSGVFLYLISFIFCHNLYILFYNSTK